MRHVTREAIEESVDRTVARIRHITGGEFLNAEDKVFGALIGHFRRTGQDELCDALDDFLIAYTEPHPQPREADMQLQRDALYSWTYRGKTLSPVRFKFHADHPENPAANAWVSVVLTDGTFSELTLSARPEDPDTPRGVTMTEGKA